MTFSYTRTGSCRRSLVVKCGLLAYFQLGPSLVNHVTNHQRTENGPCRPSITGHVVDR
jgi:hypothetical protein